MEKGHVHVIELKKWVTTVDKRYRDFSLHMGKYRSGLEKALGISSEVRTPPYGTAYFITTKLITHSIYLQTWIVPCSLFPWVYFPSAGVSVKDPQNHEGQC